MSTQTVAELSSEETTRAITGALEGFTTEISNRALSIAITSAPCIGCPLLYFLLQTAWRSKFFAVFSRTTGEEIIWTSVWVQAGSGAEFGRAINTVAEPLYIAGIKNVITAFAKKIGRNTAAQIPKNAGSGLIVGRNRVGIIRLRLSFERCSSNDVFKRSASARNQKATNPRARRAAHASRHWSRNNCRIAAPYSSRWDFGYARSNRRYTWPE